jgi:colanic acid biosynthesis glycosyl transferase WcaI
LPSKLTTILSAGGYALITADVETELGRLCRNFPGIAERCDPENTDQFVMVLRKMLIAAKTDRPPINQVARQYAIDHLNNKMVLQDFEVMLQQLTSDGIVDPVLL